MGYRAKLDRLPRPTKNAVILSAAKDLRLPVLRCHSERSEESPHLFSLFVIPQRSGGICFFCCLFLSLPFLAVIMSAAKDAEEARRTTAVRPFLPTNSPLSVLHYPLTTTNYPLFFLSTPSSLQNPNNQHPTNHLPMKNTWHSSYAPPRRINLTDQMHPPRPSSFTTD
jgi:hypothetical protein